MYFGFVDDFMLAHNRPGKGDANRVLFSPLFCKRTFGDLGDKQQQWRTQISF